MRTDRPAGRAGAVLLAVGMAVVLAACVGPAPVVPPESAAAPSPTGAPLPPLPVSAFPGVDCDSLVGDAELGAILGDGAEPELPTIDEVALLQDGGLVCSWSAAASGASLSVRLVGDGVDHWATFNHWYEHTDWSATVGEINGTECTSDRCSVHALEGERFLEVEAASPAGLIGADVEALARGILAEAPVPQPVPGASAAPGSRSCTAALPEATALELLDSQATGASYVSTATPSYHLADDSFRRLGAVDCRLLSDDGRELVRFTILRGGAWVFRDDSPIGSPDDAGDAAAARHGDDWLRVGAPDASETVLRNLFTELITESPSSARKSAISAQNRASEGWRRLASADIRTYVRHMTRPRPIRLDHNTWLVMRNDPVIPKAVIERRRDRSGADAYFVIAWDIDPTKRVLMSVQPSLEQADALVRYDVPRSSARDGPPNGINADGTHRR